MKRRNYKHLIRKSHRYLGVFIGIQFLLWTIGGFYFSWTNIEVIRGEHLRNEVKAFEIEGELTPPPGNPADGTVVGMRLVRVKQTPYYEYTIEDKSGKEKLVLVDAKSGETRKPVSESEASEIATAALKNPEKVENVEYLTEVGSHHEYREKPMPAWAVTFESGLTVYLSAESGQIGAFRTARWRIFDFLWMLHTMDFSGRDNFNNMLLRAFSVLGIVTILSGFLLFFVSSKFFRRILFRDPSESD